MKALFISNDPLLFDETSGVRARMRAYANALGELSVISPAKKAQEVHEGNFHLYGVEGGKLGALLGMKKLAFRLIREQGIEVVSAQDPFEYGFIAAKVVAGTTAKLHLQVHTDFLSPWFVRGGNIRSAQVHMPLLNKIRRSIANRVLPKAHGIRAVSSRVADSLVHAYGARIPEPAVIPIVVGDMVPPPVPLPEHPFTFALITVGRLEPEKRIEDIISALGRVALQYPAVGLFVVGNGRSRASLEKRARILGLADKVIFLGDRYQDAVGLMGSAQAYIQASAYEGYGRTLIEAALARVPIITTDVGIVGEVFKGYDDVLAAPVADPAALAVHIVGLVEDMQARRTLAMNAEKAARAHLALYVDQPTLIARDLARTLERR